MSKKRLSPAQLEANNYNKAVSPSTGLPPTKEEYLKTLSGFNPTYSDEYSPAPLRAGASDSQRVDFGEDGFNKRLGQGLLPELNPQDVYAGNQSGAEQAGLGLTRVVGSTGLKLAQSGALLGSALGETLFGWAIDGSVDFDDVTDNPLVNNLMKAEDAMKDVLKIYKSSDWDDKSFFEQIQSSAWWADEGADGAAFALSTLIPAGAIGSLGIGAKALTKLGQLTSASRLGRLLNASRAGVSNAVKLGKVMDAGVQNAFMTSSEALFEAKDTGDSITQDYLNKYNQSTGQEIASLEELEDLDPQAFEDLKQKKADAMQHTFWGNAATLMFSNALEIGLLNKFMGKAKNPLLQEYSLAEGMVVDPMQRIQRKGLDKFLNGTRVGYTLKNMGQQMASEGLFEENVQHAIQNVSKNLALEGKIDNMNYIEEVAKESFNNLGDKEAWKSIGAGMVIGGLFGGVASQSAFNNRLNGMEETVNKVNSASNNFIKLGQIYERDENGIVYDADGNPKVDTQKMQVFLANQIQANNINSIHDYYKTKGQNELADMVKNEGLTNYVKAFMESGLEDELKTRVKGLNSYTEDDLVQMGLDPLELDERGNKITKEQRASAVETRVLDLINQYKTLENVIPESESARLGEALSWYSRHQHLNALKDRLEQRKDSLLPEVSTGDSIVDGINSLVRKVKQIDKELPNAQQFSLPIRVENLKKEKELALQKIQELKEIHAEEITSLNLTIPEGVEEIVANKSPRKDEYDGIEATLLQVNNSINDAIDKYNGLSNPSNGQQFYEELMNKVAEVSGQQEVKDNLLDLQEGDYIEATTEDGTVTSGFVGLNDSGNLVLGKEVINDGFASKYKVNKLTEEQVSELKNQAVDNFRREQVAKRIKDKNAQIAHLQGRLAKGQDFLIEKEIEREELVANVNSGTIKLSEKQFAKQLRAIERSIVEGEHLLNQLQNEVGNLNNELLELKYLYDTPESIDDVNALITRTEEEIQEVEKKIGVLRPIVDKLKSLFGSMLNAWGKLFPNKEYNSLLAGALEIVNSVEEEIALAEGTEADFEQEGALLRQALINFDDLSDYATYKEDLDLTRAELQQFNSDLKELEEERERLYKELSELNDTLKAYELEASKLNYVKPLRPEPGQVQTSSNIPVKEGEANFNSGRVKDISFALNTTAGRHAVNGELTDSESQKRWFKWTEEYVPSRGTARLRTVTIKDATYGLGSDNDIFAEDAEEFRNEKNIKVIAVDKKGEPIRKDGQLIYTSLFDAKDSITEYADANGKVKFSNNTNLSPDQIEKIVGDYKALINKAKEEPQFLDITRRSNGIVRKGNPISIKQAFGTEDVDLRLVTEDKTLIGKQSFPLEKGLVYAVVGDRPVGLIVRKLNNDEVSSTLKRLKEYSQVRGKKEKQGLNPKTLMSQINGTVFLGQRTTNPERSLYFLKGEDKLVFGDSIITHKELEEGKFDAQLTEFLSDLNHHSNRALLNKKQEYRDVHGKVWKSYNEYLVSERPDAPLMSNLLPKSDNINEPQFFSTYLEFSPVGKKKEVKAKKDFSAGLPMTVIGNDGTIIPSVLGNPYEDSSVEIPETIDVQEFNDIPEIPEGDLSMGVMDEDGMVDYGEDELFSEEELGVEEETKEDVHGVSMTTSEMNSILSLVNIKKQSNGETSNINNQADTRDESGEASKTEESTKGNRQTGLSQSAGEIEGEIDDYDNFGDLELAASRISNFEQANEEEEEANFKAIMPKGISYRRVKGLIDNRAMGKFTSYGEVLISDFATRGTSYHEAFHVVSNLLLTPKEQTDLWNEWKKNNNSEASNIQVEEALAEEFREFMLTKRTDYSILEKIARFIKTLLGLNSEQTKLFERIADGKFKNAEIFDRPLVDRYSIFNPLGATIRKDFFDGLTVTLMQELFKHGHDITDLRKFNERQLSEEENKNFKEIYTTRFDSTLKEIIKQTKGTSNGKFNEETLVPYLREHKEQVLKEHVDYLKQFNINLHLEENEHPEIGETEKGRDTLGIIDAIEFSTKNSMSSPVKMMLVSLPKARINEQGKTELVRNNLGLFTPSDTRRNVAVLHNALAGISSFERQLDEVRKLLPKIPEFKIMLNRLESSDSITPDKLYLQSQFRQQFDKARYDFYIQLYKDGNSYLQNANSDRMVDLMKAKWAGNIRNNAKAVISSNGQLVLNKEYFKKWDGYLEESAEEIEQSILSFYKEIGVVFSNPEKLNLDSLSDTMQALLKHISKEDEVPVNLFTNDDIQGYINRIVEQEVKSSFDYSDNQHINPEGKTVYNISLHNYLTLIAEDVRANGIPTHLQWNEEAGTGNPMVRNSKWLDKLKNLRVAILEGARVDEQGEMGKSTSSLTEAEVSVAQFTSVLNGKFPFLTPGDKKLSYVFDLNENVTERKIQEVAEDLKGYLADELLASYMLNVEGIGEDIQNYNKNAKDLRTFAGIFDAKLTKEYQKIINSKTLNRKQTIRAIDKFVQKEEVKGALLRYLESKIDENLQHLIDNKAIYQTGNKFINLGLPTELVEKFTGVTGELSRTQISELVGQFTYASLISNIEQTKLFTGDVAFYKDFFKRTSGLVGTGKNAWVGEEIDAHLNRMFRRLDGKQSDSKLRTWIFKDVESTSDLHSDYVKSFIKAGYSKAQAEAVLKDYLSNNEADAQGFITLPEYREFLIRVGDWSNEHQIVYNKAITRKKLSKGDMKMLVPLKPQHFGPQTYGELYVPTFYKFSVMPLIPAMIRDRQLSKLNEAMLRDGIGISVFESGNKVGANKIHNLYNEKGEIDLEEGLPNQELDYRYMKIQLDINPETKNKVTFGSQFRKLIISGLSNKSLTIKGKSKEGKDIIKEYNGLINKQVNLETSDLIKRLGIKKGDKDNYVIENPLILRDLLKKASLDRAVPLNLIESLDKIFQADEVRPIELSVNRNKIEQILMSLVDNNIIKQKVFGDMMVQGSSTGFEVKARKQSSINKERWSSNLETLKFYRPTEGSTEPMEVYLPHRFKEVFGKDVDIKSVDKRLLNIIGFRTPTQGLNSIEAIKIKGFLPEEAGNLVIVPTEIVTKSGSDFDIDKLSLFLPNYEFVNGEAKYIEYVEGSNDKLAIQNRIIELSFDILLAKENFVSLVKPNTVSDLDALRKELIELNPSLANDEGQRNKFVDWVYNVKIRGTYLLGKTGVGATALQNVHHVLTQIAGTQMNAKVFLKAHTIPSTEEEIDRVDLSKEYAVGEERLSIQDVISQVLNGFVDIAKDPFLKTLNITPETTNAFFFLTRAGVPLRQLGLFLNQPIIRDYLKELEVSKAIFLDESDTISRKKVREMVLGKWSGGQLPARETNEEIEDYKISLNEKALSDYIKDGGSNKGLQRAILDDFLSYSELGQSLSDLVQATTFDTKGTQGTIESARTLMENYAEVLNSGQFTNVDKLLSETFIGSFANAVKTSVKMYSPLFITERAAVRPIINKLKAKFKANKRIDLNKMMSLVKNDLISYLIQNSVINKQKLGTYIKGYFIDKVSVPLKLAQLKNSPLGDNYLIRELMPLLSSSTRESGVDSSDVNNIKLFTKRLTVDEQDSLTGAWRELADSPSKEVQGFAWDLAFFAILQSGINNSPLSFTQFIPNEIYVQLMSSMLENVMEQGVDVSAFEEKFYQNNYRSNDIVPKQRGTDRVGREIVRKEGNTFTFSIKKSENPSQYKKIWSKTLNNWRLFKYEGEVDNQDKYREIARFGDGINFKEYGSNTSALSYNNIDLTTKITPGSKKKGLKKNDLYKMIQDSDYNQAYKEELMKEVSQIKTAEDTARVMNKICNG